MKVIIGIVLALIMIGVWDVEYNHGALTRVMESMVRSLQHSL
jgi:hypothetical protein